MNKKLKRYLIDYFLNVIFSTIVYTPLGLLFWDWSIEQSKYYVISTLFLALLIGRVYGYLLNKWREIFGERYQ